MLEKLPPEIVRYILLFSDTFSIWSFSQVSVLANDFCDNDLWKKLVLRDFKIDREVGPYNKQYHYLKNAKRHQILKDGRIDGLELLHRTEPVCEYEAEEASKYGHLEMLKWIQDKGIELDWDCMKAVFLHDQHEIFEYLLLHKIDPDPGIFGPCSMKMAKRLINLGLVPNEDWANMALFENNIELLDYYAERNLYPIERALNVCCQFDCYDVVVWMYDHEQKIATEASNTAVAYGHLHIVKYLYERGIVPEKYSLTSAASGGFLDILIWFEDNNLGYPTADGSGSALRNDHLHVVEWLLDRKIIPKLETWAQYEGRAQKWIDDHGYLFQSEN